MTAIFKRDGGFGWLTSEIFEMPFFGQNEIAPELVKKENKQ